MTTKKVAEQVGYLSMIVALITANKIVWYAVAFFYMYLFMLIRGQ